MKNPTYKELQAELARALGAFEEFYNDLEDMGALPEGSDTVDSARQFLEEHGPALGLHVTCPLCTGAGADEHGDTCPFCEGAGNILPSDL